MDESKENIDALRENLLASLRPFCADPEAAVEHLERRWAERDEQEQDFSPIEAEFIRQSCALYDRYRASKDMEFFSAVSVEAAERRRQIRNARALDRIAGTVNLEEFWR